MTGLTERIDDEREGIAAIGAFLDGLETQARCTTSCCAAAGNRAAAQRRSV